MMLNLNPGNMKEIMMNKYSPSFKIFGAVISIFALLGFFIVADDLRHTGELIGVIAMLAAGVILFFEEKLDLLIRINSSKWIAFGLLAGIPIGGIVLDNMIAGEILGLLAGTVAAVYSGRKKNGQKQIENESD